MTLTGLGVIVLVFGLLGSKASELHLLNLHGASIYANSVAEGSSPDFAADIHYEDSGPTCFHSKPRTFDRNGYSWLIIDLGYVVQSISELRISIDPASHFKTVASQIEVFISSTIRSAVPYGGSVETRLPWGSYDVCGASINSDVARLTAVVTCREPLSGRWVILRRRFRPLHICFLAIYNKKGEDECFSHVDRSSRGVEFRFERHVPRDQCRESCRETPVCEAIVFKRESRDAGMCRLLQSFDEPNAPEVVCNQPQCQIEENICHRGQVYSLVLQNRTLEEAKDDDNDGVVWSIESQPIIKKEAFQEPPTELYALQFHGIVKCRAEDCGNLVASVMDKANNEYICGTIDTKFVSKLDKHVIFCGAIQPVSREGALVRLRSDRQGPDRRWLRRPEVKVSGGYARFTGPGEHKPQMFMPILPNDFYALRPHLDDELPTDYNPPEFEDDITTGAPLTAGTTITNTGHATTIATDPAEYSTATLNDSSISSNQDDVSTKDDLEDGAVGPHKTTKTPSAAAGSLSTVQITIIAIVLAALLVLVCVVGTALGLYIRQK